MATYSWALHSWVFCLLSPGSTEGMGNGDWGQVITLMPLPCPCSTIRSLPRDTAFPKLLQCVPFPESAGFQELLQYGSFSMWFSPSGSDRNSGSHHSCLVPPQVTGSDRNLVPAWIPLHGAQLPSVSVVYLPHLPILCACCNLGIFADIILTLLPITLKRNSYQLFLCILFFIIIIILLLFLVGGIKTISSVYMTKVFITVKGTLKPTQFLHSPCDSEEFLFLNWNWKLQVATFLCCINILNQMLLILLLLNLHPFIWVFRLKKK